MLQYAFLAVAIALEVTATLSLRAAVTGRPAFYLVVVAGYCAAFGALLGALRSGLALGVAYGVWAAAGVALTAVGSKILFDEPLTRRIVTGIVCIAAGVLFIELVALH